MKRSEWSTLLLTAMCALLALAPAEGATVAAASAPGHYAAVLLWLRSSAGASPQALRSFTLAARASAVNLEALEPYQIEALLTAISQALPVATDRVVYASDYDKASTSSSPATFSPTSHFGAASHSRSRFQLTSIAVSVPSPATAPRHDATYRFKIASLTPHEAGLRSGVRTNRSLE